jgi:predicted TPR repeat methyltransferase
MTEHSALGATPKTAEGAIKLYDEWASSYDSTLTSWGYVVPKHVSGVAKEAGIPSDAPILDLGCGTGLSGEALSACGFSNLYGCDISQESLKLLAEKGVYQADGLKPANLEEKLPYRDGEFQCVTCVGTLSYVHSFEQLYREVRRITAPGGLFIFSHRTAPHGGGYDHEQALWDRDADGCRTIAWALEKEGIWQLHHLSLPSPYMPTNPDPTESQKRIRVIAFRMSSATEPAADPAAEPAAEPEAEPEAAEEGIPAH